VLAIVVCSVTIVGWLVTVLAFGDAPPKLYIAVLYIFTMFGGPASMVAFAVARDYNSARILGTASGVVNVGGFVATVIVAVGFGAALNLLGGMNAHNLRLALLVPLVVQLLGTLRVVVWDRRVRAYVLARQRIGAPVPVPVLRRYWWDLRELGDLSDDATQESLAS
jgi:hypothetical protein